MCVARLCSSPPAFHEFHHAASVAHPLLPDAVAPGILARTVGRLPGRATAHRGGMRPWESAYIRPLPVTSATGDFAKLEDPAGAHDCRQPLVAESSNGTSTSPVKSRRRRTGAGSGSEGRIRGVMGRLEQATDPTPAPGAAARTPGGQSPAPARTRTGPTLGDAAARSPRRRRSMTGPGRSRARPARPLLRRAGG